MLLSSSEIKYKRCLVKGEEAIRLVSPVASLDITTHTAVTHYYNNFDDPLYEKKKLNVL